MTTSTASSDSAYPLRQPPATGPTGQALPSARESLAPLVGYFLKLGTLGFGGPVALVGYMHRDLVERRRWVTEETYRLALALAQIMPGPLAAQCAIALGYFQAGLLGATLVGVAFVVPSFLMVLLLSWLYVTFGGLWWMQALFYGIAAAVIGIIAIAAYKLARSTNKQDPLLWGIWAVLTAVPADAGAGRHRGRRGGRAWSDPAHPARLRNGAGCGGQRSTGHPAVLHEGRL